MRFVCLLICTIAFSAHAADQSWVQDNCPRCYQSADKNYLFKVNERIVKFSPELRAEASAEYVDVNWVGLSNPKGETTQQDLNFTTDGERERFLTKFKKVCSLFKGFGPVSTKASLEGGELKMTCSRPILVQKNPEVKESMDDLVNFLSGSEPKKKNLAIYDEDRGEEARNPRGGAERLPASAAGVSGQ